jgi:DNA-binding PadR family transcriptional regulator
MHAIAHRQWGRPYLRAMGRHRGRGPGGPGDVFFGPGFGPGPGFPFGPGFGRGGRGRRAGRGDVRAAVLLLLDEEPRNGYALMQEIEQRSDGVWRPSPGSIYPALAQLEDEGLVRERAGSGSGRTYELTDAGRAHVAERREELGEPWKAAGGGMPKEALELRDLMVAVAKAASEVLRSGSERQRADAVALLSEARRGLYRILAEDPAE